MVFSVHYLIGGYSQDILREEIRLLENSIHMYELVRHDSMGWY
jgi:hypothetical protein